VRSREIGRPRRVLLHGLPYFCNKLAAILKDESWDVRHHPRHTPFELAALVGDLSRCDLAFTWGGRISMGKFLWVARFLGKKKLVLLWSGSDVLFAQQELAAGKMDSWVKEKIHWAVSPCLADEVRSMGLSCEYVQASFIQPVEVPAPLPGEFSVLVYVPGLEKANLYGLDQILEVADTLRSVKFTLVGWTSGQGFQTRPNVKIHGRVSDLSPFIERATVIWRPVRHDAGISFMVLEALAQGRQVLYSYPFPACTRVNTAEAACTELEKLLALHELRRLELNHGGMETVARDYAPSKVRAELLKRWEEIIQSPGQGVRQAGTRATGAAPSSLNASTLRE
jgi:glycosyltransferase involved in cell wall biosynthesis